jgi:hypothetical protein
MNTEIKNYQIEQIIEVINQLDYYELVILNNEFCLNAGYTDAEIYGNDEDFFSTFFSNKPHEVARAIFYGDYNYSHENVMFDGYGNLKSFPDYDTINQLADTIKNIAENVCENPEYYTMDISYIFENK